MKEKKWIIIQTITLLFLFGFIFYQSQLLSSMEKRITEAEENEKQIEIKNKALESSLIDLKKERDDLKTKNEKLEAIALDETKNGKKIAYLTFDDGPSINTMKILDILDKNNVKATFFVNGNTSDTTKELYKKIVDRGHSIGNHTYSHDYSSIYRSKEAFFKDFNKLQDTLNGIVKIKPTLVRFPGGSNNRVSIQYGGEKVMKEIIAEMNKKNYTYYDWNVDSTDASGTNIPKDVLVQSVLSQSKGKQHVNVLMHDTAAKSTTVAALPEIIKGLKAQGFEFKNITEHSPVIQFSNK